jgi:hypothetical protein
MSDSGIILDYRGPVNFDVIDFLLKKLKKTREYKSLNKVTAKRLYSIVVECLENICKHSELGNSEDHDLYSRITIKKTDNILVITSGNPVTTAERKEISARLDNINKADGELLKRLYEEKLTSDFPPDDKCAGLGFIYMAIKSGNKIKYNFSQLPNGLLFFEIEITLNIFIMRALTIDQKNNSPKIILDPENRIFMIEGESRPPDVREFYGPVLSWLEEFSSYLLRKPEDGEPYTFNFNLEYFNSSSGKLILDICKHLAGLQSKGQNVTVNWYFEKDDFDMLEAGKEISKIVKMPFEYVVSEK